MSNTSILNIHQNLLSKDLGKAKNDVYVVISYDMERYNKGTFMTLREGICFSELGHHWLKKLFAISQPKQIHQKIIFVEQSFELCGKFWVGVIDGPVTATLILSEKLNEYIST